MPRTFAVYSGDRRVLTIRDEPGALLSTALPPPDPNWRPPQHPFLSGSAQDASSEHELAELLAASSSFDDYLARLREAGYRVEAE